MHLSLVLCQKEYNIRKFQKENERSVTKMVKRMYVEFYGERTPKHEVIASFSKSDVAQDGCTVLCRAEECYKLGIHRCAACEMVAYCSERCRIADRPRHHDYCRNHTIRGRITTMRIFQRTRQKAKCQGQPFCQAKVQSFCTYCLAPACDAWVCAKYHLDHCHEYTEFLENDWVLVEHTEAPIHCSSQKDDGAPASM